MNKVLANPNILKWARETLNLSLEEVAAMMSKSVEIIRSWEDGQDSPTYIQLEQLAYKIYGRPLAIFFFPQPPVEDSPKKSFRTLPETEYQKFPSTLIKLFRKAQVMQINLSELCDGKNPANKNLLENASVLNTENIFELAEQIRNILKVNLESQKSWKNAETAFEKWRNIIETYGIFIFKDAFRVDEVSGFCLYNKEFPIMYINNSMPKTRQIFTIFHELAHLLFETGGIDKNDDSYMDSLKENDKSIEIFCNKFAAEFLVPSHDFDKQIIDLEIDDFSINKLAERYIVSREVILRKLLDRHLVSREYYLEKVKEWIQEAKKSHGTGGGDYYINKVVYLGEKYLNIAFSQYYKNHIDKYQLAEYLNIKVNSIDTLEIALSRRTIR